jgi:hypothetical protein
MRNQRSLVVAAGIAALLIPASAAQAATKQVTIGPAKPLKGVPPVAFDADFYPRKITIAKGDHIRFKDDRLRRRDLRAQGPGPAVARRPASRQAHRRRQGRRRQCHVVQRPAEHLAQHPEPDAAAAGRSSSSGRAAASTSTT